MKSFIITAEGTGDDLILRLTNNGTEVYSTEETLGILEIMKEYTMRAAEQTDKE